tara:strand:- start:3852 stop:4007 length:156 start_codon:yes stop_codon:yes gene_type:complete
MSYILHKLKIIYNIIILFIRTFFVLLALGIVVTGILIYYGIIRVIDKLGEL